MRGGDVERYLGRAAHFFTSSGGLLVPMDSGRYLGGMLAHLQARWPTLVRVAVSIAIVVGLWAIHDPIGYVFAVILVAVVWLWDRDWQA